MDLRLTALLAIALALLSLWPAQAAATHVSCGDTITQDTTLDSDLLGCPGDGLVIGADKIALDLNGHTISGLACADPLNSLTCVPQDGIDNSAGHDRVVIQNGTIAKFENGVLINGGDRNQLLRLEIPHFRGFGAPGTAVSLLNSDRNRVVQTHTDGDPAILLRNSDRNVITDSSMAGVIAIHAGTGLAMVEGSDENRLTHNRISAESTAVAISDSRRNLLEANDAHSDNEGADLQDVEHTVITGNTFTGGRWIALSVHGDENLIRDNAVPGGWVGIALSGARNLLESNRVEHAAIVDISVGGLQNLVRKNDVESTGINGITVGGADNAIDSNSVRGSVDGVLVNADSTAIIVRGNLVTGASDDGIDVDAPGTLIRRNVANDNGDFGIEAVEGVIDGRGNRASGNGNPLQCLNVFCK
jgi:large repetitive protein